MRIGIDISVLNDSKKTGIGVYTYNLIENLLRVNKKDKFILFGISTFQTYHHLKNLPFKKYSNVEIKIFRLPARSFRTAFLIWQKLNWPPIEYLIGEVDIFHSFNWNLPPIKKTKLVATVFDITPIIFPRFHQPKTIQLDKIRIERIQKNASLVSTISQNSKKDFLKLPAQKRVEVIYPGVEKKFQKRIDKKNQERILKKYDLKKNYILTVGTIEPRKNIRFLINSYLKSGIENELVLVGLKGWEKEKVFEVINKNPKKIKVLGFIPDKDLPLIYSQAACLVYPSFYEGFGLPILEAFVSRIPVICSKNSSLTEVGADAVYYINPRNSKSLIKALRDVTENKFLKKELIKKGLKQSKKFSWEKSALKLNKLYRQFANTAKLK